MVLPSKKIVFVPGTKLPPLTDQFPVMSNVPDDALNVPEVKFKLVILTAALDAVKIPPLIFSPPLKF